MVKRDESGTKAATLKNDTRTYGVLETFGVTAIELSNNIGPLTNQAQLLTHLIIHMQFFGPNNNNFEKERVGNLILLAAQTSLCLSEKSLSNHKQKAIEKSTTYGEVLAESGNCDVIGSPSVENCKEVLKYQSVVDEEAEKHDLDTGIEAQEEISMLEESHLFSLRFEPKPSTHNNGQTLNVVMQMCQQQ